jgi:hypothetical protein
LFSASNGNEVTIAFSENNAHLQYALGNIIIPNYKRMIHFDAFLSLITENDAAPFPQRISNTFYTVGFYTVTFYTVKIYTITFYTDVPYTVTKFIRANLIRVKIYTGQNLYG